MKKSTTLLMNILFLITLIVQSTNLFAAELPPRDLDKPSASLSNKPLVTPQAPALNAKAYILIDVNSGKVLAEKNSEEHLAPASLTKMMTLYVISNALNQEQIHLNDMAQNL